MADEIMTDIGSLSSRLRRYASWLALLPSHASPTMYQIAPICSAVNEAITEIDHLTARVAKLEAVIRPIAVFTDAMSGECDDTPLVYAPAGRATLWVRDLRAARDALGGE